MNTTINKAVVALLGGIVTIVATFGVSVEWATPEIVSTIGSILTAALVWAVPNKAA